MLHVKKGENKMTDISKKNADMLGLQTLLFQTQEECGELIKAIGKYNRTNGIGQKTEMLSHDAWSAMIQEIADVSICIEQLTYLLDAENVVDYCKNAAFHKVKERYKKSYQSDSNCSKEVTPATNTGDNNILCKCSDQKEIKAMKDLPAYVEDTEGQIKELLSKGFTEQAAVAIVSMAAQLYTADHMNQNVTANMTVKDS